MRILDGIGSLFSSVLFNLKCIVDNLVSLGNSVERTSACYSWKSELSPLLGAISSTILMKVPFKGRPSSIVYLTESL